MLFKRIEMYNFGRYAGKNTFDTTVTRGRNVILVRAPNDRGKTTLFKAIKFALYGDRDTPASSWINFQAAAKGDGKMYVEIVFDEGGKEHRLRRSVGFRKTPRGEEINIKGLPKAELFRRGGGAASTTSGGESRDRIDAILPRDASQFFFFDGEEIQGYIKNQGKQVKHAIEKILGIKELYNAADDLRHIKDGLDAEYSRIARSHTKSQRDREKLDGVERELAGIQDSIDGNETLRRGASARHKELKESLAQYESIKSFVEERGRAEAECARIQESIKEVDKSLAKQRGDLGISMLVGLLDIIDRGTDTGATADECESRTIRRMVDNNAKTCVCGRAIDAKSYKVLEAKTRHSDPPTALLLKRFVERMLIDIRPYQRESNLRQSVENRAAHIRDRDTQRTIIQRCMAEIKNNTSVDDDITRLERDYEEAARDMGKYERDNQALAIARRKKEAEKEKIEGKIEASMDDVPLQHAKNRKRVCDMLIEGVGEAIEQFYQKRKPELEGHVSRIFTRLTNNPELYKGIKIDREFNLVVVRHDGTELPTDTYSPSAGASQIVATAMIGGMNRFATIDAPIVVDTPLGRLDDIHRTNVMRYYSEMGRQVIILYQPKEIGEEDMEGIRDQLASEWAIESLAGDPDLSQIAKKVSYV